MKTITTLILIFTAIGLIALAVMGIVFADSVQVTNW